MANCVEIKDTLTWLVTIPRMKPAFGQNSSVIVLKDVTHTASLCTHAQCITETGKRCKKYHLHINAVVYNCKNDQTFRKKDCRVTPSTICSRLFAILFLLFSRLRKVFTGRRYARKKCHWFRKAASYQCLSVPVKTIYTLWRNGY